MANDKNVKTYDLGERTAKFSEHVLSLVRGVTDSTINRPMISQLVKSATSVGANYMEADGAESKKDFIHKIGICRKEAKETEYWLRIISSGNPDIKSKCDTLSNEARELSLIFSKIITSSRQNGV